MQLSSKITTLNLETNIKVAGLEISTLRGWGQRRDNLQKPPPLGQQRQMDTEHIGIRKAYRGSSRKKQNEQCLKEIVQKQHLQRSCNTAAGYRTPGHHQQQQQRSAAAGDDEVTQEGSWQAGRQQTL